MIWKHAGKCLSDIKQNNLHGTSEAPPDGFLRGIDVLAAGELRHRMANSMRAYYRSHEKFPDMIAPKTFTEKQVAFKFFAPVPVRPSPSDKLRSCAYMPASFRGRVALPERYALMSDALLPPNDALPPGSYYYKSNHGSGTNMRISYPLSDRLRKRLENVAANWLTSVHAPTLSLWWYENIERTVFIEEDLGDSEYDIPDWKFFVCNGRVEIFQIDVDRSGDHRQTIYDRNGQFLDAVLYHKSGPSMDMPAELDLMLEVAEAIGRSFDFIRVDLFLREKTVYLGEIGLVPMGARRRIVTPELDERLGAAWHAPWLGRDVDYENGHYGNVACEDGGWGTERAARYFK